MCRSAAASEEDSEIFLSPAVTYGPPGLDLSCPIAMTVAHCAEVAADNWSVRLKRQAQDNKWEVRASGGREKGWGVGGDSLQTLLLLLLYLLIFLFWSQGEYQRQAITECQAKGAT